MVTPRWGIPSAASPSRSLAYRAAELYARRHDRRVILHHGPDRHARRSHYHVELPGGRLSRPFEYGPRPVMAGVREGEAEWEQLAEMEGFAGSSPALAVPARARVGGVATAPGERQVDRLVQRVGRAVSAGLVARGHADDEGEAMFGWLRRVWSGNPAAAPPAPPAAPVDTVLVCHYAPSLINGEIRAGSYWTDFHSRNRGDVARITGRDPAGFNYRYELYLPRTERDRIFRNTATKMVPGLPASDEYVSRVPIPASRARPFRMP